MSLDSTCEVDGGGSRYITRCMDTHTHTIFAGKIDRKNPPSLRQSIKLVENASSQHMPNDVIILITVILLCGDMIKSLGCPLWNAQPKRQRGYLATEQWEVRGSPAPQGLTPTWPCVVQWSINTNAVLYNTHSIVILFLISTGN